MRTISYGMFLDLMSALDEFTQCQCKKTTLMKYIFNHYISQGPFIIYNSWNTKGCYTLKSQKEDFINFMNLIKKPQKVKKQKKSKQQ